MIDLRDSVRFESIFNEREEETLVPVKPYEQDFLDLFDNFEVIHGGGEGSVIKARRKSDGRTVALKKYFRGGIKTIDDWKNSEIAAGREKSFLERAARDGVENVPKIIDFGVTGKLNEAVVAMEYVDGRTLDAVINSRGFIPDIEGVVRIAKEVAKPLKYVHKDLARFVHRDIKPANIMVDGERVVVLDWSTLRDRGLTLKNTQLYSPNYTAPEVLKGTRVTPAADVYSLGKTLEHCLLGSLFETKEGKVNRNDLKERNVPEHIIDALMKATQSDSNERYQSVTDFVNDLERKVEVKQKECEIDNSVGKPSLRDHPLLYPLGVLGFCSSVIVLGVYLTRSKDESQDHVKYEENEFGFKVSVPAYRRMGSPYGVANFFAGNDEFTYTHSKEECGLFNIKIGYQILDRNCDAIPEVIVKCEVKDKEKGECRTSTIIEEFVDASGTTGYRVRYVPSDVTSLARDLHPFDKDLESFYSQHKIYDKILKWKADKLSNGLLAGDSLEVNSTGFTIREEDGFGNFSYIDDVEGKPYCSLNDISGEDKIKRDILDYDCDSSVNEVIEYNSKGEPFRFNDAASLTKGNEVMRKYSERRRIPDKIQAWRKVFGRRK